MMIRIIKIFSIILIIILNCACTININRMRDDSANSSFKSFSIKPIEIEFNENNKYHLDIKISIRYNKNIELTKELGYRNVQIKNLIVIILKTQGYNKLKNIDLKELSNEIKGHINIILVEGKIEKVIIEKFKIQ